MQRTGARRARASTSRGGYQKFIKYGAIAAVLILIIVVFLLLAGRPSISVEDFPIQSGSRVSAGSNTIYAMNGTTLSSLTFQGETNWSMNFQTADLNIANSDTIVCLYNDSTINVIGADKTAGVRIDATDFTIKSIKCGTSAVAMLAESTTNPGTQYIRVFNFEGVDILREEISKGYVLDFGFYHGDQLWYTLLDTSGTQPASVFTLMDPAQKNSARSISLFHEVITDVFFIENTLYISGTSSVRSYAVDDFTTCLSNTLIYGLDYIDVVPSNPFLLLYASPSEDTFSSLRIIAKESDLAFQLQSGVFSAFALKDKIFCFKENSYDLYDFNGNHLSSEKLTTPITKAVKISQNRALLWGENGVKLITVK